MREEIATQIAEVAKLLDKYGKYPNTTKELFDIADGVKAEASDFEQLFPRYLTLYDILEKEFAEYTSVAGQEFRRLCFNEISLIILRALKSVGLEYFDVVDPVRKPISKRLEDMENYLFPVAVFAKKLLEEFSDTKENRVVLFHLEAYSYLVSLEGIFDDLARLLFFFEELPKGNVCKLSDLERMDVKMIIRVLKYRPFFLINWEERCHWRNAIAHAHAYYDPDTDIIHFISVKQLTQEVEYDKHISMWDFLKGYQELDDARAAYILNMLLVSVFWLLMKAKHEKK